MIGGNDTPMYGKETRNVDGGQEVSKVE